MIWSLRLFLSCAIKRSLRPLPYTSAVSMKLIPQSIAFCNEASPSSSETFPHDPPMAHAPKLTSETFQPVRPSGRYSMSAPLSKVLEGILGCFARLLLGDFTNSICEIGDESR